MQVGGEERHGASRRRVATSRRITADFAPDAVLRVRSGARGRPRLTFIGIRCTSPVMALTEPRPHSWGHDGDRIKVGRSGGRLARKWRDGAGLL